MVSRQRVAGYGRQVRSIDRTDQQRLSNTKSFACTRLGTAGTEYRSGSREATSRVPHDRQLSRARDRSNAASPCQRPPFPLGSRRHRAAVAQLVRAPDCGSGGRWFESTQLYQQNQSLSSGSGGSIEGAFGAILARKSQPQEPIRWSILILRAKAVWLGDVEAASEAEAIAKGAERFGQDAERLMAVKRSA
jgi:hypothetical protein